MERTLYIKKEEENTATRNIEKKYYRAEKNNLLIAKSQSNSNPKLLKGGCDEH
jgi:hypothetical protein